MFAPGLSACGPIESSSSSHVRIAWWVMFSTLSASSFSTVTTRRTCSLMMFTSQASTGPFCTPPIRSSGFVSRQFRKSSTSLIIRAAFFRTRASENAFEMSIPSNAIHPLAVPASRTVRFPKTSHVTLKTCRSVEASNCVVRSADDSVMRLLIPAHRAVEAGDGALGGAAFHGVAIPTSNRYCFWLLTSRIACAALRSPASCAASTKSGSSTM